MTVSPLSGIRVIDFSQYIAGPGASAVLADLGADVVKVEPVEGEATRNLGSFGHGMYHAYNRGKRSIALDLRSAAGRRIAQQLVDGADVLVQNMRPGAMDRLGLGVEATRHRNSQLIYGSISGFGSRGEAATRAGLDIAAQAESGMMWITGEADREPQRVGFAVADASTAHVAAQAILAALFQRERTGAGEALEVSLLETALHMQAANLTEFFITGVAPTRSGNGQPTSAPAADLIATSDGWIVLSAYTDRHWKKLCEIIGRPELVDDAELGTIPGRVAHRARLHDVLSAAMRDFTSEDCVRWLSGHGLVAGAVRNYDHVSAAPNVATLGAIQAFDTDSNGGPDRYVRLPYRMSTVGVTDRRRPAPRLGEHSRSLLLELGMDDTAIEALVDEGVVGVAADSELAT